MDLTALLIVILKTWAFINLFYYAFVKEDLIKLIYSSTLVLFLSNLNI